MELSQRGFLVLCMNIRSDNNETLVRWETIPLDFNGVLKKQRVAKILLWGFSGGGARWRKFSTSPCNVVGAK
jgi:hypothetical protein